jgi:hypothetical protein
MKKLLAIVIAGFCLTSFAAEPAEPVKEGDMILAKKKDHTQDNKPAPRKSPKSKTIKK